MDKIIINIKIYSMRANHSKRGMPVPILITSHENFNGFILKTDELMNVNIDIEKYSDILKQIPDDDIKKYLENKNG